MGTTLTLETVKQCNRCMDECTLHPWVSVIDLAKESLKQYDYLRFNFYGVMLLEQSYCTFYYGRRADDYSDGTLLFLSPQQCLRITDCDSCFKQGKLLVFHRDLFCKAEEEHCFPTHYTFFAYADKESLHISQREKQQFLHNLEEIRNETAHEIDRFSALLLSRQIELLLDYCRRFYERQFITRRHTGACKIAQFNQLLNNYIHTQGFQTTGYPTPEAMAQTLELSPAYFQDLLHFESGKTYAEYVNLRRIDTALQWIKEGTMPLNAIARQLGYTPRYFSRLFKLTYGQLPSQYKSNKIIP